MARLILDTSMLIAAERDARDPSGLVDDDDDPVIAAITAAELLVGVELASGRRRARRAEYVATRRTVVTADRSGFADLPGLSVRAA